MIELPDKLKERNANTASEKRTKKIAPNFATKQFHKFPYNYNINKFGNQSTSISVILLVDLKYSLLCTFAF